MIQKQPYGLQALTPMYGQVIQSAPSWSGPFNQPDVAPPVQRPKQQSTASVWGGLAANLLGTAGCAAYGGEIGMLACPILGQIAGSVTSEILK